MSSCYPIQCAFAIYPHDRLLLLICLRYDQYYLLFLFMITLLVGCCQKFLVPVWTVRLYCRVVVACPSVCFRYRYSFHVAWNEMNDLQLSEFYQRFLSPNPSWLVQDSTADQRSVQCRENFRLLQCSLQSRDIEDEGREQGLEMGFWWGRGFFC